MKILQAKEVLYTEYIKSKILNIWIFLVHIFNN